MISPCKEVIILCYNGWSATLVAVTIYILLNYKKKQPSVHLRGVKGGYTAQGRKGTAQTPAQSGHFTAACF